MELTKCIGYAPDVGKQASHMHGLSWEIAEHLDSDLQPSDHQELDHIKVMQ